MFKSQHVIFEAIQGYCYWSLFEALAPMIWFYPLNELEISGYEAFAVAFFSPLLLFLPPFRWFVNTRPGMALLRATSVVSLVSFQAQTTLHRLVCLAIGVAAVNIILAVMLTHPNAWCRKQMFWGLTLGKLAHLSSRVCFTSFAPAWWSNASNTVVVTLAMLTTLEKILSGYDFSAPYGVEERSECRLSSVCSGLALGSVLYLLNALFGEVSIVTRWTVAGYPDTGPQPHPWGALVLICLGVGMLSSIRPSVVTRPWLNLVSLSAGLFALYLLKTWAAFAGGLLSAVSLMHLWPDLVTAASLCNPATTFGLAMVTYVAEILFSVWTVAYNFVPGGVYTREHTGWLLGFIVFTLVLGVWQVSRICFKVKDVSAAANDFKSVGEARFMVTLFIGLIVSAGLGGFIHRLPRAEPPPHAPRVPGELIAAVWTYHFGYDNQGWPSLERSADMLQSLDADIITLLESDASKPFLGNNDLASWLGERLGMHVDFGVSTRDHTWGNLILSRYPFVKSNHLLLPSPHGELAPGVSATVNVSGDLLDLVVTHMGNDRDDVDRRLQAKVLANELSQASNPVIFLGYVTSAPFSRDYKVLTESGRVRDIDNTDTSRWCEYIFYRDLIRLGYARVSHAGLSDTEVQAARFRFKSSPEDKDHERLVINADHVRSETKFTSKFGSYYDGHYYGQRHHYHMSTPKYFLP